MQPIFSAINDAHRSLELPPPACDSFFLKRVRTGLGRVQAAVTTRHRVRLFLSHPRMLLLRAASFAARLGFFEGAPALRARDSFGHALRARV